MANARSDVLLVIKARDEGERVIASATEALRTLFDAQSDLGNGAPLTGSKLRALAGAVKMVEGAYSKLDDAADRASGAFARQNGSLDATRAKLAQVRAAIEREQRSIGQAQHAIVSTRLAGGDTAPVIAALKQAETAVRSLQREELSLTRSIDAQEAALGRSRNSLQQLGSVANAAEAALVGVGTEAERAALKSSAAAAEAADSWRAQGRAIRELLDLERRVGIGKAPATTQGATFDALDEQARAMVAVGEAAREVGLAEREMADQAARLRDRIDPLAAIQRRLNTELEQARKLKRANIISDKELAAAEAHLAREADEAAAALERQGKGERGRPSVFGLKPYELTNLGYQINDVFTQLASGTSLTQTLAQQGGQLLQLFPKLGSTIVAALGNPVILGAAAGVGVLVAAIARARGEAERLRSFQGFLTTLGDGARYSARELSEASRELRRLGVDAQNADASVRALVRGGINPSVIRDFGETARDMAAVLPDQFENAADASKSLAEGFDGTFEGIERLNQATGALTVTEMRQIRTMFEQGQQAQALARAYELVRERMDRGADAARGPWQDATRSLRRGWDSFLESLGNTRPVNEMISVIDQLGDSLATLGDLLNGDFGNIGIRMRENVLRDLRRNLDEAKSTGQPAEMVARLEQDIATVERRLRELRGQRQAGSGDGGGAPGQNGGGAGIRDANGQAEQARQEATNRETRQSAYQLQLERYLNEAQRVGNRALAIRLAGEREYARVLAQTSSQSRAAAARVLAERAERNRQDVEAEERARRGGVMTNFTHPLRGAGRVSSGFGYRTDPIDGSRRFHPGIDYAAPRGTPVYATGDGRITRAGPRPDGYGISIELDMGGIEDLFGHLSRVAVQAGQTVRQGDLIGYVGSTGRSTGPHLHHRRRVGGRNVDPALVGTAETNPAEADNEQAQENFNRSLEEGTRLREMNVRQARELVGLSGQALFDTQRRHEQERAVAQAEEQARRQGLALSREQREEVERTVAAEFDVVHARERATQLVEQLGGEREAMIERLRDAYRTGDEQAVTDLAAQLQRVDTAMESGIANAMEYWRAQGNTPEARAALTRLATLRDGLDQARIEVTREHIDRLRALREALIERMGRAFDEGDLEAYNRVDGQLDEVTTTLGDAVTGFEAFWRAAGDSPEARAALADLANLRSDIERTNDNLYQRRIETLGSERQALLQRFETLGQTGGGPMALDEVRGDLRDVDRQLLDTIAAADEFWARFEDSPERTQKRATLAELRDEIAATAEELRRRPTEQALDTGRSRRDALWQQVEFLRDQGMMGVAGRLQDEIRALDADVLRAIDHLIELWRTSSRPEAAATIAGLQNMRNEIVALGREFAVTAGQIQGAFSGSLSTAAIGFGEAIGSGRNAINALWESVRGFASDFLRQIAEMLAQQAAMKAAMSIGFGGVANRLSSLLDVAPLTAAATGLTSAGGTLVGAGTTLTGASGTLTAAGGLWQAVAGQIMSAAVMLLAANAAGGGGGGGGLASLAAGVLHDGGIAGSANRVRSVPAAVIASAVRYHGGGVAGLNSNEVAAVLEEGEEVLTRDNPRHIFNLGRGGGASAEPPKVDLAIFNGIDPGDMVARGLSTRPGQQAIINLIRSNAGSVNAALGGGSR